MSKKKYKKDTLSPLLRHYGLSTPAGQDVQERMAHSYDRIYKKVIKRTSRVTIISSIITALYFLIKKTAVPVSLIKIATAVLLTASISTGMYFALKGPAEPAAVVNPSVIIRPFTTRSLDKNTGILVAQKISSSLNDKLGKDFSSVTTRASLGTAPWSIFGTVEKIDRHIVIITKVIDSNTSRLHVIIEEKCRNIRDIDGTVDSITRKLPFKKK